MDANIDGADNHDVSTPNPIESEITESWTFLGDESTNPIHQQGGGVDKIVEHPDDDETKLPSKTSRSSSSCFSDNFLSVTNHGIDGDISDGISVISDCDSISDRHSPMPRKRTSPKPSIVYSGDADIQKASSGVEDNIQSYSLVERSTENEVQVLSSNNDSHRHCVQWNPSNIILFGLIVGAAAILSSQCWKMNLSHENIMPEMSLLAQRIQDLESENLALKVEVNRLVELHHAGQDHSRTHERDVVEKRSIKQKKVWTGADDAPIRIPKEPVKEDYCKDEYLNSDDLFAGYNLKKCEDIDEVKERNVDQSKQGFDDNERHINPENRSQQVDSRRKKNVIKDDSAKIKREKFAEPKFTNAENQKPAPDTNENVRNKKFVKIQEERQKIFDEATQKYLDRQKKMENKQQKDDRKTREDPPKESKNGRKQPKDTDSEWYDKMMKQREVLRTMGTEDTDTEWYDKMMKKREELRAMGNNSGGTKQKNKENWYTERGNEREKVRGTREKQTKSKQYR